MFNVNVIINQIDHMDQNFTEGWHNQILCRILPQFLHNQMPNVMLVYSWINRVWMSNIFKIINDIIDYTDTVSFPSKICSTYIILVIYKSMYNLCINWYFASVLMILNLSHSEWLCTVEKGYSWQIHIGMNQCDLIPIHNRHFYHTGQMFY